MPQTNLFDILALRVSEGAPVPPTLHVPWLRLRVKIYVEV